MVPLPIPVANPAPADIALFELSFETRNTLVSLHVRDSDLPAEIAQAACLYEMAMIAAGFRNWNTNLDPSACFASAAACLTRVALGGDAARLAADFAASADDLAALSAQEAFDATSGRYDALPPPVLAVYDQATQHRFSWIANQDDEVRAEALRDLFARVAEVLKLGAFFEFGADADARAAWRRDAVAALPDYAARKEDCAEWAAMVKKVEPDYRPRYADHRDTVLFDLLAARGLRRTGSSYLKMRRVDGTLSYSAESVAYEKTAARFAEVDWVWRIKTTGADLIYYADPATPEIEKARAARPKGDALENTAFVQQQAAQQARRAAKRAAQTVPAVPAPKAPSAGMMARIRGWLQS